MVEWQVIKIGPMYHFGLFSKKATEAAQPLSI